MLPNLEYVFHTQLAERNSDSTFETCFVDCTQSHYREDARWEIFMEQELRFGLDLGQFGNFEAGFFMFSRAKKSIKNIVDSENVFGIE